MTSILYARKLKLQNNRFLLSKLRILSKNNISSKSFLTKSFLDPNKKTKKKLSTIPLSKKILLMQIMKRNQSLRKYKNRQRLRKNKSQRIHIQQEKPILQLNHCSRFRKKRKLLSMKFLTMLMNLISNFNNKVLLSIRNKRRLKKKLNLMFQSMEMKQKKNLHKIKLNLLKIKLKSMYNLKFNNINKLKSSTNNLKLKNRHSLKLKNMNSPNPNDVNSYLSTTFILLLNFQIVFPQRVKNHIKLVKIEVHGFINQLFCFSYLLSIVRLPCNPFRCQNRISFVDSHSKQHNNILVP